MQLRAQYLQQKMQRAVQQPRDGWTECIGVGRKCLLLNADSFVLATSRPAGKPPGATHLSQLEPELFAELLDRGLVKKCVHGGKSMAKCCFYALLPKGSRGVIRTVSAQW